MPHKKPPPTIGKDGWLTDKTACLPSPHHNERPTPEDISSIVLHNITLPPLEFGRTFVDALFLGNIGQYLEHHPFFKTIAELRVSAHFFIERDGSIVQYVSTHQRAWHAGTSHFLNRDNCNDFTIGIELNGADHIPYTHRQYLATATLIHTLRIAHPSIKYLTTHSHIAPERKTDPGAAFNHHYLQHILKNQPSNCYTESNSQPLTYHA